MTQWTLNTPNDMVVAYPYEPGSLDPARAGDTASMELFLNVYETLTFFDEEKTNQFIPHLATKWEISPDGLTYTFTIRQGVKFHNGETLTTEDVEYSLERFLVIEGIMAYTFYEPLFDVFGSRDAEGHFIVTGQQIDNAITRNQTTVTIHLTKPYPPFMQILSQAWTSILCKNWCISIGDWPGTWNNWTLYNSPDKTAIENQTAEPPGPHLNAMCGTGPYMLDYYRKGVEWSMVKFDNYWGGWPAPGSNSFLQRVTAKKVMNWEVRKNWFLEGQLDYTPVPENAIDQVLGAPGIKCVYPLEELICYAMFFTFNISTSSPYLGVPGGLPEGTLDESGIPPDFFSDINVRKGFAYAFNYTKLIEEEVRGEAYQPATPIVPGLPFYNPAQEKYAINLTKAAEYFAAAWNGELMEKGFNFTICYYEGNLWRKKVCEIVKANVESISSNFHIQIQSLPTYNQYLRYSTNHSLPIFGFGWLADYADPHDFAYGFMYSGGGFPPLQMYSNQTIDTLVLQGIGTMNETARRQIYYELQSLYHEDCPSVPLYQPIGRRFERDWVQGWYYNPLLVGNYFYIQWKGSIHLSTTYSWPMLHHDLTHAGYSDSPAPNTNQTLWKYNTSSFVFTSPAIVDGKVYFGSYDRNVYCLDALTGTRIWNYTTGEDVGSSPTVVDGRVYIGSADHNVYCLDASSGALIWNHTLEFSIYSSPAFAYGRVYIGSRNCLNASNGALLWSNPIGSVGSSPAVVDGKVYADSEFYGICCLDAFSGALIWNYTSGYDMRDPAVVDGRVYFGSWGNKTYCLNALTGEQIWNYTTGGYVLSLPAVAYGKVYVGSYDNKLYCLDALTGERIWSYTTGDYVGPPSVADNKVYVVSEDGKTYCFDASTGAAIWSYYTFGGLEMPPAVADGIVFVGSVNGVYAFGKVVRSDDYPTIQAAINNATAGATIIIAPGIYNESIVVNKTLTIIGLPGSAPTFNGGGSGIAITLLPGASGSTIAGIVITHWDQGILIIDATNIKIYDNIMSLMNCNGITLEGNNAANNLIYSNILQDNTVAVNLTASSVDNTIYKNIISSNNIGLSLESSGHVIYANTISENEIGINILNSGNIIYHNNFIDNTVQVYVSMGTTNTWDDGYPSGGNYWSIYTSPDLYSGSNTPQNNPGSDGIVDTQYTIATNNVDRYPLLQPFNPHDIGITNVITSKTVTGQGFSLLIEVKILNYGVYTETFTITAYANTIVIATQTITQESRNSCIITLTWNTSGFVKGMYTITAYVWPVQGETDTADNNCPGGSVLITKVGDLGGGVPPQFFKCDGFADGKDLALFLQCYRGQAPSQAMYLADLGGGVPPQFYECDGIVNGKDLALFLICFHGSGP
jgi:peptide/nickel transport system substrate-binding protein